MNYIYRDDRDETEAAELSGFEKLLAELQAGDCMVVERFSGAAKSSRAFLAMLADLDERGIRFRSVEEGFDTGTEEGRFAVKIMNKVAQLDGEARREKQREGINNAKEDGKYKGRKPIDVDEELFDSILERWKNGEITARQAMAELDLKPNTFYRRVKERMPDAKTGECILDAAKKFGKDVINTVQEGTEAAGKFAADADLSSIGESVKKNLTAAGMVFGKTIDSLSKNFQDAVEKYEKKQQEEAAKAAEEAAQAAEEEAEVMEAEIEEIVEEAAEPVEAEVTFTEDSETEYL